MRVHGDNRLFPLVFFFADISSIMLTTKHPFGSKKIRFFSWASVKLIIVDCCNLAHSGENSASLTSIRPRVNTFPAWCWS